MSLWSFLKSYRGHMSFEISHLFFLCLSQSRQKRDSTLKSRWSKDTVFSKRLPKGVSRKNVRESQAIEQVVKIGSGIFITCRHEVWMRKRLKEHGLRELCGWCCLERCSDLVVEGFSQTEATYEEGARE